MSRQSNSHMAAQFSAGHNDIRYYPPEYFAPSDKHMAQAEFESFITAKVIKKVSPNTIEYYRQEIGGALRWFAQQ